MPTSCGEVTDICPLVAGAGYCAAPVVRAVCQETCEACADPPAERAAGAVHVAELLGLNQSAACDALCAEVGDVVVESLCGCPRRLGAHRAYGLSAPRRLQIAQPSTQLLI